jgi:hypothetical protein
LVSLAPRRIASSAFLESYANGLVATFGLQFGEMLREELVGEGYYAS